MDELEKQQRIETIDAKLKELMKKYRMSMWAMVACIVLYLIFLFAVKASWSTWVVLAICAVMIVIAIVNTKIFRQIQKLAKEKADLKKPAQAETGEDGENERIGTVDEDVPIVANAMSLNDLPKQYTVLDNVPLGEDVVAEHIVVSPYGIAVVARQDVKGDVEAIVQESGVEEAPIFIYSPDTEISELAEKIQMEKTVALSEPQIMKLLYKFNGLS